ncbi:MAG: NHLP bacteriocin export ABC transporter permease/ATPase subunit [Proteobacteria bacterium]|nr:NHLP bacteriocin export ABC transporter permease/ATPase subunit [Pseudomonadota bacterium]
MQNLSNHIDSKLKRRETADSLSYEKALKGLAHVVTRGDYERTIATTNPVLACASVIAAKRGFEIKEPLDMPEGDSKYQVIALARYSGFRVREVVLKGNWIKRDGGPMLAFYEEGMQPVCLLPLRSNAYEAFDPLTGERRTMTEEESLRLSPMAFTFYKPFDSKPLTLMDICRMILWESKGDIYAVGILGTIVGLIGMATPVVTGIIFDSIIPEAARSRMTQIFFILFALALSTSLFELAKGFSLVRIQGKVNHAVQSALWDRLLGLPVPFFRNYSSGDLAKRSLGITTIIDMVAGAALNTVLSSIFSIFNLFLLFYYDWGLALIAVGLTCVTLLCTLTINLIQLKHQRASIRISNKNAGFLFQLISGVAKVKMTGSEKRAFVKWSDLFSINRKALFSAGLAQNVLTAFNSVFPLLTSMTLFSWMIFYMKDPMTTGSFLAFIAAFGAFQGALLNMTGVFTSSLAVVPIYEALKPILITQPENDQQKSSPGKLTGDIEVAHVYFRYGEDLPLVLDDVSISAKPGEFIAIVGGSGSGKSTLLRLLIGFDKPEAGTIYYDKQDLDTIDILESRRQFGVAMQNGMLTQGSIFENIVGQSNLTIEDAWDAAQMAGVADDIKAMPMGMHTVLPAGGGVLSGGQRQRIVIARSIVKKPKILFFDEATSALDNKTQAEVSKSLEDLKVTRVVIAHRLSTIINADRIYVMDKGRVLQSGNYEALMAQDGLFKELAARQIA